MFQARPMYRNPHSERTEAGSAPSHQGEGRSRCCAWRVSPRRLSIALPRSPSFLRRSGRRTLSKVPRLLRSGTRFETSCRSRPAARSASGRYGASSVRPPLAARRGSGAVAARLPPPAAGGALGERLARDTGGEVIYDWGGGLIWAALPPNQDAQATLVRQRAEAAGGHPTLLRASDELRRNVDVFPPQPAGLAALSERVRQSFDPKSILNRGRMIRGFAS